MSVEAESRYRVDRNTLRTNQAFIVGMTVVVALVARRLGLPLGVSPEMRANEKDKAKKKVADKNADLEPQTDGLPTGS